MHIHTYSGMYIIVVTHRTLYQTDLDELVSKKVSNVHIYIYLATSRDAIAANVPFV